MVAFLFITIVPLLGYVGLYLWEVTCGFSDNDVEDLSNLHVDYDSLEKYKEKVFREYNDWTNTKSEVRNESESGERRKASVEKEPERVD